MYSWGIIVLFFIYELIYGARSIEITRDSLERWEGGFADVLNYSIYAISGFTVMCYFYFIRKKGTTFQRLVPAMIALLMGVLILGKIYHTTSFITMAALIALALFRIFKKAPSIGLVYIILIMVIYLAFGEKIINESFDPLVSREVRVYQQGRNEYRLFNGRLGRWTDRWEDFNNGNIFGKILGSGVGFFSSSSLIGIAVHNDYFRITFFTGFLGIIFYLLFYVGLFARRKYLDEGDRYLLEASMIILFIYSISTLPTMYPPLMYFLMSVYVYTCLPAKRLLEISDEE
jgi:O-antigen ligase